MGQQTIDRIIAEARSANPQSDEALLRRACAFAEQAHREQKRASGDPYIVHPLETALTLAEMRLDDATIVAGLLHDVVDDTPVTLEEIEKQFGAEVAFLVNGVTKLGKIKYRGVERHVENLRKMFLAMAEDIRVILVKLADRLHNMETIAAIPAEKQVRIARETLEVYSPLAGRLGMNEIKMRLDDLSFPIVFPKEYDWLIKNVREEYAERKAYIESIIPTVREEMEKSGIAVEDIQARAKHYFSLWRKLQRKNMDLAKVYDLVALRIILPDVTSCYAALGAIHNRWRPLPGRIKDYIAIPKPNGYQSLHTTVFCEEGRITEVQIRTKEMQAAAEHGIAAHWFYREGGKVRLERSERFRWVQQLREWQKEVRGTDEFLDALRIDFFQDRIFVFTPKGDVLELPEGASPLDFAYSIHSEVGDQAIGAKVNDRFIALDTRLKNGDVVEVVMQKGKKPTAKLLDIARTSFAQSHIRKSLREQGIEVAPRTVPMRAEITLGVEDRVGVLKDITAEVSRAKLNMTKVEGTGEGMTGRIVVHVTVGSRADMKRLLERLTKIKGVHDASGRIF